MCHLPSSRWLVLLSLAPIPGATSIVRIGTWVTMALDAIPNVPDALHLMFRANIGGRVFVAPVTGVAAVVAVGMAGFHCRAEWHWTHQVVKSPLHLMDRLGVALLAALPDPGASQGVREQFAAALRQSWSGMVAVAGHPNLLKQFLMKCSHPSLSQNDTFCRAQTNVRPLVAAGAALWRQKSTNAGICSEILCFRLVRVVEMAS